MEEAHISLGVWFIPNNHTAEFLSKNQFPFCLHQNSCSPFSVLKSLEQKFHIDIFFVERNQTAYNHFCPCDMGEFLVKWNFYIKGIYIISNVMKNKIQVKSVASLIRPKWHSLSIYLKISRFYMYSSKAKSYFKSHCDQSQYHFNWKCNPLLNWQ